MDAETARALDAINRRFYNERAGEFDRTRERPWRGWETLWEKVGARLPGDPRVLDVGCGNGRFARFLASKAVSFHYHGIDRSPLAFDFARKKLSGIANVRLWEHDFIMGESPLPAGLARERFDLVVLFGVLHHVPGASRRRRLLMQLAGAVAPNGFLAFTVWRFERFERFQKKLVPWDAFLEEWPDRIDTSALEPGDGIMTWGAEAPAYRYVHAMSDAEMQALERVVPLTLSASFLGDDSLNHYEVFTREEPR